MPAIIPAGYKNTVKEDKDMGRKYSDRDNEVFKRTIANNRGADGKVDWNNVAALSAVSGKS